MAVFLSYAHEDAERVEDLRRDLEDLVGQVWLDRSLTGGQLWWEEILAQLRSCSLFVLAVSEDSLRSEACLAEVSYAVALQRPFLAVHIDESDLSAAPENVRRTHVVAFQTRNPDNVKALAKAVFKAGDAGPLPAVLPEIPPIPRSYRDRFADLFRPDMTMDEQVSVFALLKFDIDNGTNQREATELLRRMYERPDLSWKVRQSIEAVLSGSVPDVNATPSGPASTSSLGPSVRNPDVWDPPRSVESAAPSHTEDPLPQGLEPHSQVADASAASPIQPVPVAGQRSSTGLIAAELIGTVGALVVGNMARAQFDAQDWFFDCYNKYPYCDHVSGGDLLVGRLSQFLIIGAMLACVACVVLRGRKQTIAAAVAALLAAAAVIGTVITWAMVPSENLGKTDSKGYTAMRYDHGGIAVRLVLGFALCIAVVSVAAAIHSRHAQKAPLRS